MERICDRFEAAWRGGSRPRVESHLELADEPLRTALLRELVPLDWEYRLRAGERPEANEYMSRFPSAAMLIESIGREFAVSPVDPLPLERMGAYRIVRQVGRGGMGVVYEAVHEPYGRRVALKVLSRFDLADRSALERFRREARTTARLRHPNIVQTLEVGEHEGQPFHVLEFVAGPSLSQRLRKSPSPPPAEAAALVETLARAIHYAHEQGVVHRDLKPANVLLANKPTARVKHAVGISEASLAAYTPKIADFGLAHPVDAVELTATGEIVGTPCYMAPEQAWGKSKQRRVGPAADIYALGALLYESLAGRPPFEGATALETLEQVRSREPVPPSRWQPQTPHDLETICLKCLEKEPNRRYASALALAEDLNRFQSGESVRARRASNVERFRRWHRRNPALAAAAVLAVATIAAGAALAVNHVFTLQLRKEQSLTRRALHDAEFERAQTQRNADELARQQQAAKAAFEKAERFRRQAERLSAKLALERGLSLLEAGETARGMLVLGRSLQIAPLAADDLQRVIRSNLAAAERQLPFRLHAIIDCPGEVHAVAFSPDGRTLLTGGSAGAPQRYDVRSGEPLGGPLPHDGEITAATYSPDGVLMATAGVDNALRLWDAAQGAPVGQPLVHENAVQCAAFSPSGKTIATGDAAGVVRMWETGSGEPLGQGLETGRIRSIAFSPDGKRFVVSGEAKFARVWDAAACGPVGAPMQHHGEVCAAAFSPDGRLVVTGGEDGIAQLWRADTGEAACMPLVQPGPVRAAGYTADGKTLWTAGAYGNVRLWDAARLTALGPPLRLENALSTAALSADQCMLATASADGKIRLWRRSEPAPGEVVLPHEAMAFCLAVSPDGKMIATGSADGSARLWDAVSGKRFGKSLDHQGPIFRIAFSPDGATIATASADKSARIWDASSGAPLGAALVHPDEVHSVSFSADGRTLLTGCKDAAARLWDVRQGSAIGKPLEHAHWVHAAVFSPDGATILTGCEDATARLWDAATGVPIGEPMRHRGPVRAVAFSPDGKTLLTATWDDRTARFWDAATRKPLGAPLAHQEHVVTARFSPDGKVVATGSWDGTARLWDFAARKPLGPPLAHRATIRDLAFSPDGATLWTASFDQTVRSWQPPAALAGDVEQVVLWIEVLTGMELDQDGLFRELDSAVWRERRQMLIERESPPAALREVSRNETPAARTVAASEPSR